MDRVALSTASGLALLALAGVLVAGPLTPPAGSVGPSYKTLTEVEPRTPIGGATTPGANDCLFKITQPGSYYLTGNITGQANKHGIVIAASGVTIDLNGFRLAGVPGSYAGITASQFGTDQLEVRNGTVTGWGTDGIGADVCTGSTFRDLRLSGNGFAGLAAGIAASVTHCAAVGNSTGFTSSGRASFTNCTAYDNTYCGFGVQSGTLTDCTAASNAQRGFSVLINGTLTSCNAESNGTEGFFAQNGCTVRGCTALGNGTDGFRISTGTLITECSASQNGGSSATGAGIHAVGPACRIDSNMVQTNDLGILCDYADALVVRNSARANAAGNFSFLNGAEYGQILTNPGNGFVATNPWANFAY